MTETISNRHYLFPVTSWSLIRSSQSPADQESIQALDRLARAYWRPMYAYVRAMGLDHATAEDEVQRLFQSIVSRDSLRAVAPGETRFRCFLIACVRHTIFTTFRREGRQKRGGGAAHESLQQNSSLEADTYLPEQAMDQAWAREVFERAFGALEADAKQRGRLEEFGVLRPLLRGEEQPGGYTTLSEQLGAPEGTVRKRVFDLRARLGMLIRNEVAATVADAADVEEELRYLVSLL